MSVPRRASLASQGQSCLAGQGMASRRHRKCGRLAQLVERFLYTEDVGGSSPSAPTRPLRSDRVLRQIDHLRHHIFKQALHAVFDPETALLVTGEGGVRA